MSPSINLQPRQVGHAPKRTGDVLEDLANNTRMELEMLIHATNKAQLIVAEEALHLLRERLQEYRYHLKEMRDI